MTQIILIALGFLGVALILISISWGYRWMRFQTILRFPLARGKANFTIKKAGFYSICFYEARYAKSSGNFRLDVIDAQTKLTIPSKEFLIKPQFFKDLGVGLEFLQLRFEKTGDYILELEHQEDLIVKTTMIPLARFFQKKAPTNQIEVMVKTSLPIWKRILTIIFLVFGINIIAWGIITLINPEIFN